MARTLLIVDDPILDPFYRRRDDRRAWNVECLGDFGWFFCSQVHDLQQAVDWCAAFRMVKGLPGKGR
jgi:hypothetical protein